MAAVSESWCFDTFATTCLAASDNTLTKLAMLHSIEALGVVLGRVEHFLESPAFHR